LNERAFRLTNLRIQLIKISWKILALMMMAILGASGHAQAKAYASTASSSTVIQACVSKAFGTGRVVSSAAECRQDEYFVTLNESRRQEAAIIASAQAVPSWPDLSALALSLNAYRSVFAQASGKSRKECQSFLSGRYQGRLQDLAQAWCDAAKRFEANEQGCQVGGSPESPTLTCVETLIVYPKDGDPKQYRSQKTFHLSGDADGAWQISGW
jgi:hypothetical protein